ncbi:hypothetical protein [Nocardioides donggukensis]|uniref:Uncharacterized protein n=1 Tax=Nocardioides donggukensis TaxID=2774019 RepID=A0A927Q1A5_9ACTN|nr:hypothetical protein [Nocardioides donggukensis]MBD8869852.1 hypothetical protein [Nocardioides donggukensis]
MAKLPDEPPTFRPAAAAPHPWTWRLEDSAGRPVEITGELSGATFASQADAESWVGEVWSDLAALGVDAVSLYEADRLVYGPMSLHP